MATFDLNVFLNQPSAAVLETCRKDDLFLISQYFEIPVSKTLLKKDLKACLVAGLISKNVLPSVDNVSESAESGAAVAEEEIAPLRSPVDDPVTPIANAGAYSLGGGAEVGPPLSMPKFEPFSLSTEASPVSQVDSRLKLRLARLQLETQDRAQARKDELQHQLELYRVDADTKVKMRQLELQARRDDSGESTKSSVSDGRFSSNSDAVVVLPNSTTVLNDRRSTANSVSVLTDSLNVPSTSPFNVAKNIVIVPPFREKEVEAYFQAFERIASALKWPTEVWSLMLQCKLTGKAQEVCASLPLEESVQYETVKNAILRAYELVPEHYRQRFRSTKRSMSQTYVEFAREKGLLFDRWIKACKVTDYISLRELLLIEEFKNCVPERTALYLNEQKVSTVQQAAVLADEYALMHKPVFLKRTCESGYPSQKENEVAPSDFKIRPSPYSPKMRKECGYCHKVGHIISECRILKQKQERLDASRTQPRGSVLVKVVAPQPENFA